MEIDFQNSKIEFEAENITVKEMLKLLDINPVEVVVTKNGRIIVESSIIKKDDEIKIIKVIYGG